MEQLNIDGQKSISLGAIAHQAGRATDMMTQVRSAMLSPTSRKTAPTFNLSQLALMLDVEKSTLTHRMNKGDLPSGKLNPSGTRREFTLAEARVWIREYRKDRLRPAGAEAITISVGNFKGGVGKTTTAMTLAQGLTLLGHKVLVIDTDPQGSLTTLFGKLPDAEVTEQDTILPLILGNEDSIRYAIRPTYWDGIDLVAAAPALFGAEFALPSRQTQEPEFEFWNVLHYGVDDVRPDYDVIVIDTPPSLSYTTINAFMASNGIVMPLPPNALDFASAAQFWSIFSDLTDELLTRRGLDKEFDFLHILLSRVDSSDVTANIVRQWIQTTYAEKVLPVEIPKTAVTATASAEFGTVYDVERYDGNAKTFKRARDAYDLFVSYVETSIQSVWRKQVHSPTLPQMAPVAANRTRRGK
ncbi:AAA family ATPase [Sphaerotilus uruguayifluvii]|uniref:Chromosome partitioning protein n=1 Tax=Sphaerotilus uruguayifluvii TaxID=2735897 RepID=A0ABX2G987_9BURK|nr:AAA family ATPase [Leptothrix sp. C29]NRT58013.1 chromosome partitioning protein [Leptothrix sp. C29]